MMLPDALQCYNWARDSRVFRANIRQIVYRTVEQTDDDDDAWRSIQQSSSLGKLRRSLSRNGKEIFADFRFVYLKAMCYADDDFPALISAKRGSVDDSWMDAAGESDVIVCRANRSM